MAVNQDDRLGGLKKGSYQSVAGMLSPGNINLHRRPIVHNKDGSISTVRSISIGEGNQTTLIPTVVGKRVVSNQAAVNYYRRTGQHLGKFASSKAADNYAESLHENQAREYLPKDRVAKQLGKGKR